MKKRKFSTAFGSRLPDSKVQRYGEELERISRQNKGRLKPEVVVHEARRVSSPLHDYFEWNDAAAAAGYRLDQARYLMRNIEVTITHDREERVTRAFHCITFKEEERESAYVPVEAVVANPEYLAQVIKRALAEADAWRGRWREYSQLEAIFEAIEETKRAVVLNPRTA
jgi:hypothetical protein